MALKHDSHVSAHSSAPTLSHTNSPVTPSDKLLSAVIALPVDPRVVFATYIPDNDSPPYEVLERGRRFLVSRNRSLLFFDSIFSHTHVDGESSALHAFMITSEASTNACLSMLQSPPVDGLKVSELSSFGPRDLYPCSSICAEQLSPCADCLDSSTRPSSAPDFSAANLLPRKPLRTIYSRFLEAIRTRLIDDIAEASKDPTSGNSAHRLVNGFLLASSPCSNEWGADWLHHARLRPLVHCQLEVHLDSSRLEVYTYFRPTDYLPLHITLPLAAGTPITLLPFRVPAYFLSNYTGPTSAVTTQFEESLSGLGAGEWKLCSTTPQSEKLKRSRLNAQRQQNPAYVIAWLAVQNKQGEDKGMPVIWPSRLCISFTATSQHSTHARRALSHIPDLSPQLQPSPPLPTLSSISADSSSDLSNGLVVPPPSALPGRSLSRRIPASPTSDSLRAFRYMSLSKSSTIDTVASEIGSYIESVAREREKERERIRREREVQLSASPKAATTPIAAPVTVSTLTNVVVSSTVPAEPTVAVPRSATVGASQSLAALTPDTNPPSVNTFYPSPPSTNSKPAISLIESEAPSVGNAEPPPPAQPESSMPYSPAFDDFETMDTSWSQPTSELMNLGVGYDMPFDMNVDAITGGGGGGSGGDSRMNMDFEDGFTFTEDDFDFFDRPSNAARPPGPPPVTAPSQPPTVGPPALGLPPVILNNGNHSHGVPSAIPTISSAFPASALPTTDVLTPRYSDPQAHDLIIPTATELLPSPDITPHPQSVPATPYPQHSNPTSVTSTFDPIPFAHRHKLSDSKYDMGKFALPSPPDEEDRTEPLPPASPARVNGWYRRYSAATDPRVGLVRRLIGVKRKSLDQGRPRRPHPSWLDDDEDAQGEPEGAPVDPDDAESDGASDSDEPDAGDFGAPSRPTTPPGYLPHGASLLHMQFQHPYLLPLSKPLRPPGAAVAPMTIPTVVPASVPTPVSPAAALGAASEKSKSLEAAGSMIAREVVENSIFANAWRASKIHTLPSKQIDIWPADVTALAGIIRGIGALDGPIELLSLLSQEQSFIQRLEPPMFSVGKGESIVQLLPSSLRFWRKLGLTPCGGKKDVTAYLLFEDNGPLKQHPAKSWLQKMSSVYSAHHLGSHSLGTHSMCASDGILASRFDSLRKSLVSFIPVLPTTQDPVVLYIALSDSSLSLASPLLRQILSTIKRIHKLYADRHILFQFIPEPVIIAHDLGDKTTDFEALAFSVYERIALPVDRTMSRRITETEEATQAYFREPLFTISRAIAPTVSFSQLGQPRTLDVLDRHTFLHVGYRFSSCGKWLLASCVDQRGESYDVGSWLTQDEVETSAVIQVWNFAAQFARRANIEWRLVIAKLGVMSASELDSWILHLSATVPLCRDLPPMHISVVSADHSTSWSLLQDHRSGTGHQTPPRRIPNKDVSKTIYVDITTAATYFIYPSIRIPLPAPTIRRWADTSFVPDNEGVSVSDTLPLLPISTTILLHTATKQAGAAYPTLHIHLLHTLQSAGSSKTSSDRTTHQEVTRNYHELAVLARVRGQGSDDYPLLPLHLAALENMHDALRQEDAE
ncbi:mediator complex subunit 13 C-terminal-domain-containing protein [Scleroderma citrinum]